MNNYVKKIVDEYMSGALHDRGIQEWQERRTGFLEKLGRLSPSVRDDCDDFFKEGVMLFAEIAFFKSIELHRRSSSEDTYSNERFCRACGEIKPLDAFALRSRDNGKRETHCKECRRSEKKTPSKWTLEDAAKQREKRKLNRDAINQRDREKRKRPGYKPPKRDWRKRSARSRGWYAANPGAKEAHAAVNIAVTKGLIPRVSTLGCAVCGAKANHYHHHRGYEEQYWLDVIAVCQSCHATILHKKTIPQK